MTKYFYASLLLLLSNSIIAQTCTTPGQTPSSAFPVCGTGVFSQTNVPICGGRSLPSPKCPGDPLADKNPFWYKFTCFQAGSLGFVITPANLGDDYDWELYDVTGLNPDDVFTNGNIVVSSNWSGESGKTGASPAGTQPFVCAGFGKPLFSSMVNLQVGHNYILLISHFTNSQSGYSLSFGGGTAVITDSTPPAMKTAEANCGGDVIRVKLNKKIKCKSISANGSEFVISPSGAVVTNATGINCSAQFDTDSLQLQLSQFLAPGNYTLQIKNGNDGNTLLDYCDNAIAQNAQVPFTILPKAPTPLDSIAPLTCAPNQLHLIFRKPILCSSIAANGSDFTINGTYPASVSAAAGACNGTSTKEIIVTLGSQLQQAGTFNLVLKKGSDGNTIVDECGEETPVGASISFSVKDTVNADFSYTIDYGCKADTVQYSHAGGNGVNSWQWNMDEGFTSTQQNPVALYKVFNEKNVSLVVSNGYCSDSVTHKVMLINFLKADFSVYEDNCPNEPTQFTSTAQGIILNHSWLFGDGGTAQVASPIHVFTVPQRETSYNVKYTVTDTFGCQSTASKTIKIYTSCYLAVPNAFTPNGDNLNDVFHPLNAIKAEQFDFKIYNRWGQMIFSSNNWKIGWDGKINGVPQGTGTYLYMLRYVHRETKKMNEERGTFILIR
jgi:gliding motility-associated-like protein